LKDRRCPKCGWPIARCACSVAAPAPLPVGKAAVVRVGRETKGRAGKGVTVVTGVPLDAPGLAELASTLKRRCGSGGTAKDGVIEIQGDHRDVLVEELSRWGWTVKKSGG
jgi:translation initiation factor 1